jgi:hypothetical protein
MRYTKRSLYVLGCVSHVLGQVSLWMGVVLALLWSVLYAAIARHLWVYQGAVTGLSLPFEPPLIGVSLAVLGLWLACLGHERVAGTAVAGLILNGVALGLATALISGCLG